MGYIEEYIGAHIVHQFGVINGLAIDKGIHIAYSAKNNGVVERTALNFPKRAQFHVASVPEEEVGDWTDHLRGATKMLEEKYPVRVGMSAVIELSLVMRRGKMAIWRSTMSWYLRAVKSVSRIVYVAAQSLSRYMN